MEKLYSVWTGMKNRCYGKNIPESTAKYYRDKGVKVCDEWRNDFREFRNWAFKNGYKEGLSIDRIDSDGNYEPSNCQWITKGENSRKASKQRIANAEKAIKEKEEIACAERKRLEELVKMFVSLDENKLIEVLELMHKLEFEQQKKQIKEFFEKGGELL